MNSIFLKTNIVYGTGSRMQISSEFRSLKCKRVMIVTDKGIVRARLLDDILRCLEKDGIYYTLFDEVVPDPDIECVTKAKNHYIEHQCDGILAVGGGSSIDTAKGAGILIKCKDAPLMSFVGIDKFSTAIPPFIAVPTTCGTGSEVTNVTVITDEQHAKLPISSKYLIPDVAVLDPELLYSLPSEIVAATGMDALTHAVEALTNKNDNWYAEACALKAIRMIRENIRPAVLEQDKQALASLLYASTLAGIAFSIARLGLVHAMSHPVSGWAKVPHGLANAILLPYILRFNLEANPQVHALFAREFGIKDKGDDLKTAIAGAEAVEQLNEQLGIPKTFSEIGVDAKLIPQMIVDTFKSGNVKINAREVTEEDVKRIYEQAFSLK